MRLRIADSAWSCRKRVRILPLSSYREVFGYAAEYDKEPSTHPFEKQASLVKMRDRYLGIARSNNLLGLEYWKSHVLKSLVRLTLI